MIELRGLHLGNIARSPAESVRPDLWPVFAYLPVLGVAGQRVIATPMMALLGGDAGPSSWEINDRVVGNSVYFSGNGYSEYPINSAVQEYPVSFFCVFTPSSTDALANMSLLGCFRENSTEFCGIGLYEGSCVLYTRSSSRVTIGSPLANDGRQVVLSASIAAQAGVPAVGMLDGSFQSVTPLTRYSLNTTKIGVAMFRDPTPSGGFIGNISAGMVFSSELRAPEHQALHADPLLPFRRRQPVFYSVPSGSGNIETPAAMMMAL